jgi:hypothetical protein
LRRVSKSAFVSVIELKYANIGNLTVEAESQRTQISVTGCHRAE